MVLPLLWDSECAVKTSREKITCCKLLSRAGIGAQSPQAQPPFQWLLDCEEQPTREQEVGSRMEEPWWRFPQSFVKQLRCERWSKRFGWVKGWLVSSAFYQSPLVLSLALGPTPSFPSMFSLLISMSSRGCQRKWMLEQLASLLEAVYILDTKDFFLRPLKSTTQISPEQLFILWEE